MSEASLVPLGEVAEFVNGAAFKPTDWEEFGRPIIRIQNLTDSTRPYNRTTRVVSPKLLVQPGDLLVSWSATLGVFDWSGSEEAVLNQHIFRVLPDGSRIDKSYLRHVLSGALVEMTRHLHGATMQHVNRSEFLGTPIRLPLLEEQRRIAEVLDRADALRAKRGEALALLDDLAQSIFLDMFGDADGSQQGHPLVALGEMLDQPLRNGLSPAAAGRSPRQVLTLSAVTGSTFNAEAVKDALFEVDPPPIKRVSQRDLLICRGNGNRQLVGRAFFPTRDMPDTTFPDTMIAARISASIVRPIFLEFVWRSRGVRSQIESMSRTTNGTFKINQGSLEKVRLPLPPPELQDHFSDRIAALLATHADQQAQSGIFCALFASLQQRAFAGEL